MLCFRYKTILLFLGLTWFLTVECLIAQTFQAQLTGVVRDASGAVVPGAKLTALNIATGVTLSTVSNESGVYRFPDLKPGQYRITCDVSGFKEFEDGPITLLVNQVYALDVTLEPGMATEHVTVSAAPAALQTENATLSQVVTTRSIQNLPLNIRDPFALVALTPGVQLGSNFGAGGGKDVGRNYFKSDFYVGGSRSGSQEILIDGAPDTTPDANKGVIDPPVDTVQEFAVQASTYSAQFGRTSGAVMNVVTKSGTNDIHGLAYDFERHSVLDANNFFNNRSGIANPSFQRHQFGGDLGLPLIKNKWFAFGDYEGLRQGYPITSVDTVPTALQRQGNFSQTFTSTGALITVYDPSTLQTLPSGNRQRSPFPGNVITATALNPVALATVNLYPLPNTAGNPITNQNNYIYSANSITNSNKYDLRSDADMTENTRMFVRVSRQKDLRSVPGNMPLPIGGGRNTTDVYTQAVADLTHVFSATTVGDINFSFTRALAAQYGASQGFNLASIQLPASYIDLAAPQFPIFNMTDVTGTSNTSDTVVQYQPRNTFATLGSISHQAGRHSLKFGGDWRLLHFNEGANNAPAGTYSFTRGFTQGPNPVQASATAGFGFASFLLGDPASGSIIQIDPISTQGSYYAAFFQDDWKVTDRLTLNLGIRWEVGVGDKEKYNRLAYFSPGSPNPLGPPAGLPNLTGELQWIGDGNPSAQMPTDWHTFAPRFGLAYKIDNKTVVRGGYGIYYLPQVVQGNGDGAIEAVRTTTMVATIDGLTPFNTLSNPFPATNPIQPAANDRNNLANIGSSITAPIRNFRNGYAQSWSLEIERELPWGMVLSGYYWGSKGTRLLSDGGPSDISTSLAFNINQLPDQYLALGSHLNDLVPNPFYGVITTGALAGKTISRQQSLLPFPQYTAVNQVFEPTGDSTYEGGTIEIEKRLSSTLTFLAEYTRSKAIDDLRTPLDVYNLAEEKGLSSFDAPNQFRMNFVFSLPFGHDRAYGKSMNRFVNWIAGDWDFDSIINLQSGFPISISRPSVYNGQNASIPNPSISQWFNTSAFSPAPAFTFGNVGPVLSDVRADWSRNIDSVLVKNFGFSVSDHQVTAQFRFEVYNVFNTVQFAAPNGTVSSQSFGQVSAQANSPRDIQFGLKFAF